jgi:hypothetical protein
LLSIGGWGPDLRALRDLRTRFSTTLSTAAVDSFCDRRAPLNTVETVIRPVAGDGVSDGSASS